MVELHQVGKVSSIVLHTIDQHLLLKGQHILLNYKSLELSLQRGCIWSRGASSTSVSSLDSSSTCSFSASQSSMSSVASCLVFVSSTRSLWINFSTYSSIDTSARRHNWVIKDRWMRAPVHHPWVDSMIPLSMTCPTLNLIP